ncbi:helix-turn-helix transcriptional regulator [Natronosporangium hydrolyticum]|uniref:Helix-turn-helix transcriptional regulator n=2 Tax=Natronosporangium hydrolyticum TaxID=2811111 RepID=A0A895YMP3_9ACTN|nr:helix-turn-helix transcriptional regulator [Natronosporangium hydrolyticum]
MQVPLRRVARQAGMSHGHLSKVERGEHGRPITPTVLAAYEKVTGVSLAEAAAAIAEQRENVVGLRRRSWRPGQLTDMRRLAFNAAVGAIAIGGQIGEPLGRLIDTTGRPVSPIAPDPCDVDQLTQVGELLTTLDTRYGGAMTSQLAKTILRWAIPMIEPASMYDPDHQPLHNALGIITARAAWSAVDTGSHEAARSLFRLALFCAVRAGDPHLRAHVIADAAAHHNHLGYYADALDLIRIVEGDERVAAPVRRLLHSVKARAYAAAGETNSCRRHLILAQQAHQEPAPLDPPWVKTLRNPAHLYAAAGHALADLTQHDSTAETHAAAVEHLTGAISLYATSEHARALGLCRARLAALHLTTGNLDSGEEAARQALPNLANVRSARLARALGAVRRAAAQHPDHEPMATLTTDIDAALTTLEQPYSG